MLATSSDALRSEVQSAWACSFPINAIQGLTSAAVRLLPLDPVGGAVGVPPLATARHRRLALGPGRRCWREETELFYPMLFLWRKEKPDWAAPGAGAAATARSGAGPAPHRRHQPHHVTSEVAVPGPGWAATVLDQQLRPRPRREVADQIASACPATSRS
jgi:hypothetical protein